MKTNEEYKFLDNAFRKGIDRLDLPPLSMNLDGIRADALQVQLAQATTLNYWLKGVTGLLLLCLAGLGLQMRPQTTLSKPTIQAKTITITKTDTVYITQIQKVYVPILNNENATRLTNHQNVTSDNITNQHEAIIFPPTRENDAEPVKYTTIQKEKTSVFDRSTNTIESPISAINQDNNSNFTDKHQEINGLKNNGTPLLSSNVSFDFLKNKPLQLGVWRGNIPEIFFKNREKIIQKEPKIPLMDRLSLGAYWSPGKSDVAVLKDEIEAFNYGNEGITATETYGIRLGIKLTKKLSLLTGYEEVDYTFGSHNVKKMPINAQLYEGYPSFLYRSIFGTAQVPTNELSVIPKVGDVMTLESEDGHVAGYDRVPLMLRYDFFNKIISFSYRNQSNLTLYGLAGSVYSIPSHQQLKVELYEQNGHDFYTSLTGFKNNPTTWGLTLGFGAELELSRKWGIWVEPTYHRMLTSMVSDMPLRTFASSIGIKFGATYYLKNSKKKK